MPFKRQVLPREEIVGKLGLSGDLVGIGMNFADKGSKNPNIEDTVLRASIEGLENDDLKVLSVLTTWLEVHSGALNVDRLTQIVAAQPTPRVRAFWASVAKWLGNDRRFSKMAKAYKGARVDLLRVGSDFQIQRRGEDPRFAKTFLRAPAGVLRDRRTDVLTPAELAQKHSAYRWRTIIGPSYRADMWADLEKHPDLIAADLAHRTYGSFATAWNVKKDWRILSVQAK